jgi:MFS family permease
MIGLNLLLSLFCQVGEHFSPLRTGLTLAPFALGIAFTAPLSYPLAQRFGRRSMQVGFAVMGGGIALLALMVHGAGSEVSTWTLVPGEFVAGLGMGIALPPLFDFILAGVESHEVGSASGVLNAIQQFGGALGIAVLATIFFAYVDGHSTPVTAMTRTALLSLIPLAFAFLAVFRLPHKAREEAT